MSNEPIAAFPIKRPLLEALAHSLATKAAVTVDAEHSKHLEDAARVIRGWLVGNLHNVPCARSVRSWGKLAKWARECRENTAAKVIELKLEQWQNEQDALKEKREKDMRTAAALAEYKAGGGE